MLDVIGHLLDAAVDLGAHVLRLALALDHVLEPPDPVQKPLAAVGALLAPGGGGRVVAHEHDVGPEGIRPVPVDDVDGVHHVPLGLAHLVPVGSQNEALVGALGVGLGGVDLVEVVEELMPEPGVEKVPRHVLHAAVVPVHGHPVLHLLLIAEHLIVVGVDEPEVIPAGPGPLGHGVGLPLGGAAALGAGAVDEAVDPGEGALAVGAGLEVLHIGQRQGELVVGHAHGAASGAVDQGDGLAPVPLAVEGPVLHLILDALVADALLLQEPEHGGDGVLLVVVDVQEVGVDHGPVAGVCGLVDVAALDDGDDVHAELPGEGPVPLVVGGHGHDGAGAVAHHHVVRDEDGDLLVVHGVHGGEALQPDAGLVLDQLGPLELGLLGALGPVGLHLGPVLDPVLVLVEEGMLGGHDHEGDAVEGVAAGGVDLQRFGHALNGEVHEGARGLADPLDLLLLDGVGVVHRIEAGEKPVRVLGDLQVPHVLGKLYDVAVAHVALAALGVLVGQDHLAVGAVVHLGLGPEHQSVFEHLEEDPLGPLVVVRQGGGDLVGPVEGVAHPLHLVLEVLHVPGGDDMGMGVGLDGVVLRGQAEGIEAHGEQHVVALHAALAGDDLQAGVGLDVAHVHARAGGVRKLHQAVELGLGIVVRGLEGLFRRPAGLPLRFDDLGIVDVRHRNLLQICVTFLNY